MTAPKVSIVIPAYNAASFIERTLETVALQTFRDFELLVVDDGSKDDTTAVVERFLKSRRLAGAAIRQENKKIAAARNAGIRAARGEFVAFLDHDDLWRPEKLSVVMDEFRRHPEAGLVHHPCRIVTPEGRIIGATRNGPGARDMYRRLLLLGNALSPTAVTVRRARLEEVGGFREGERYDTVEDYDLWLRLARVCEFKFIDPPLADYLLVSSGASKRVNYHHERLEALLKDHFADYPRQDAWTRLLMRRRLSQVNRAAARAFLKAGDAAAARPHIVQMLKRFPLEPKNLAVAAWWLLK